MAPTDNSPLLLGGPFFVSLPQLDPLKAPIPILDHGLARQKCLGLLALQELAFIAFCLEWSAVENRSPRVRRGFDHASRHQQTLPNLPPSSCRNFDDYLSAKSP